MGVDEEHRSLRHWIGQIRDGHVEQGLRALAAMLPEHFEGEERTDGFFDRARAQGMGAEADALQGEHAELLEALTQLLAHDAMGSDAWQLDVSQWVKRMEHHEDAENRLMWSKKR